MEFKTKRDLEEWLGHSRGDGNAYIGWDWLIQVNAAGNIVAKHPTCEAMQASFCPIVGDEEDE